jgi:mono/diheme cytochrome c family protein
MPTAPILVNPKPHPARFIGLAFASLLLAAAWIGLTQFHAHAQDASDPRMVEGAKIFNQDCAVCHGPNGEGRIGATLAKNWPSIRPDLTVRTVIENGVQGSPMPAWSQANGGPLSSEQIDAVVFYILSWQTGGAGLVTPGPTATRRPPIAVVPEVQGDPNQGAVLYDTNCIMCHGPNGEGRIGATLAKNWPSIRPDLTIKATISNGVSGSPMPAWSQANGGPLSETEIDDLVAFILSLKSTTTVVETPAAISPGEASWMTGWGGVILFLVALVVILGGAVLLQRRRPS